MLQPCAAVDTMVRDSVDSTSPKAEAPLLPGEDRPRLLAFAIPRYGLYVRDTLIGCAAAVAAVALRYAFDVPPGTLPFFTVIIAVCVVTLSTGLLAGISTAFVGGVLSWYVILTPRTWTLLGTGAYALLGYLSVVIVILLASQMYRLSERNRQAAALAYAMNEAEQQALFAREMSHRLKNAMAVVQAMANQTFARGNPELAKFDGRLSALAQAHNLLNEHVRQPHADVRELVERVIGPFQDGAGRFTFSGPPATIPDQLVISLALALHELGTNAVKYGALSGPSGRVTIAWEMIHGKLRLEWQEKDGPPVSEPKATGFGTRLLRRTAMGADLRFDPNGLRCVISQRV
jgi:two-component sensor histidine kinase